MAIRLLTAADRPTLRRATLANMNWVGSRFTFEDIDGADELTHYFSQFPSGNDFGLVDEEGGTVRGVAWLVFLPAESPGYGFVDSSIPELSVTTFEGFRGQGVGSELVARLLVAAQERNFPGISLSVEDGNGARRLYDRLGFRVVGRSGNSDTMLVDFTSGSHE